MRFSVEIVVDVDVDALAIDQGVSVPQAFVQTLRDLSVPAWYLKEPKWEGIAHVVSAKAQLCLFNERQLAAITKAMQQS